MFTSSITMLLLGKLDMKKKKKEKRSKPVKAKKSRPAKKKQTLDSVQQASVKKTKPTRQKKTKAESVWMKSAMREVLLQKLELGDDERYSQISRRLLCALPGSPVPACTAPWHNSLFYGFLF